MSSCSVLQQYSARQLLEQRIDFTSAPNKVVLGSAPIPRNVTVLESDKLRFGDSVTGSPCTSNGDALTCETSVSTTCSSASSSPASITNELTAVASPLPARSDSGKSASPAPLPESKKEQQSRPTEPVREPIKIKLNLQAIKTLTSPLVLEPPPSSSKEKREEKEKQKEERREREEKERGKLNGHLKPPATPLTNGLVPKATSTPIQNGSAKESKMIGPVLPPGLLAKKKEDEERKDKKENGIDRTGGLKRERERDSESPPPGVVGAGAVKKARRRLLSERGEKEASYPVIDKNTISSWNWDGCNMVKGRRRGCGLVNTSNDCFLNAILQTVVHCAPLCRYIVEKHTPDRCQRGKGQCVACAMRAQHIPRAVNGGGPFQPTWIRPFMKRIFPSHYHGMQEDAHELLALLLDALDPPVGGGGGGGAALPNGIQSLKPSTPIEQIFGGTLRNSVECMACGAPAVNYERIRELNLAIKRQGEDRLPLRKLIADYFQDEKLQNFSCKKCSRKTAAVRRTRVLRAPAVLLVQLKRFNAFGSKIRHPVAADPRVDLSSWMFDSASSLAKEEYVLTGVVEHLGAGVDHGHYMAFARGFGGEWHLFDDEAVTAVPAQRVHNAQPYLLVYSRREHFPQLQAGAASNGVSGSSVVQQKMNGGGGGSKLVNGGGAARMNGHHHGGGMNRSFGGHPNKLQHQQKSHNNSFHSFNKKQYI